MEKFKKVIRKNILTDQRLSDYGNFYAQTNYCFTFDDGQSVTFNDRLKFNGFVSDSYESVFKWELLNEGDMVYYDKSLSFDKEKCYIPLYLSKSDELYQELVKKSNMSDLVSILIPKLPEFSQILNVLRVLVKQRTFTKCEYINKKCVKKIQTTAHICYVLVQENIHTVPYAFEINVTEHPEWANLRPNDSVLYVGKDKPSFIPLFAGTQTEYIDEIVKKRKTTIYI